MSRSGKRIRSFCLALLLAFLAGSVNAQILGDANGDGELDMDDVAFVTAAIEGNAAQTAPFALSDLAHPCDGKINEADLRLIESAARAGRGAPPVHSTCHGGAVGSPPPQPQPVPGLQTLDEIFLEIAGEVPEFGGLYLDENEEPTVVLTEDDEEVLQAVTEAVYSRFDADRLGAETLRVALGEFGFGELQEYRGASLELLSLPGVNAIDTDEVANRLWIGLNSWDDREDVEGELDALGIPLTAVALEEIGDIVALQAVPFYDFTRPLAAGLGLHYCTMGPVVDLGGVRGFLTNSHCTNNEGGVDWFEFYQPFVDPDNWAAMETVDPPLFTQQQSPFCPSGKDCRWSDAVFATVGTTSRRGNIRALDGWWQDGFVPTHSIQNSPLAGELVYKSGLMTGVSLGVVQKTCFDAKDGWLRLCQGSMAALSIPGDSGSVVYQVGEQALSEPQYVAKLHGLVWASNTNLGTLYSPMVNLFLDLGNFEALAGNDPPSVTISAPKNGESVPNALPVQFSASVGDLEDGFDCEGCSVTWTSSKDGLLGTSVTDATGSTTLQTELTWYGTHQITAAATDSDGDSSTHTVTIHTDNLTPTVWVDEPSNFAQLPLGVGVTFSGSSFDPESFGPLGCGSLVWLPQKQGDFGGFGCSIVLTFNSPGWRVMTLRGYDGQGAYGEANVNVFVSPLPTTGPPIVTIEEPGVNWLLAREQPHSLIGHATDPDGKSPIQYEWVLKGPGLIGAVNGEVTVGTTSGANAASTTLQWLPSNYVPPKCGGIVLDLELRATDADNEVGSLSRQITVSGPLC